jgi:hypothetical protein
MTIIAICGLIGSGKDTAADYLVAQHGFKRESFAGSLKDAIASIFVWDRELLEGRTPEGRAWRERVDPWWSQRLGIANLTPRWVLQHWGTEVCRHHFHDDIWMASVENKLRNTRNDIVISDCRFPNEIQCMRASGAIVVRVVRGTDPEWFDTAAQQNRGRAHPDTMKSWYPDIHISEWAWAGTRFDRVLNNDSTLQNLYDQVSSLVPDPQVPNQP